VITSAFQKSPDLLFDNSPPAAMVDLCSAFAIAFDFRLRLDAGWCGGKLGGFPLRNESGILLGYIGLATNATQAPLLKFPDNLAEKCGVGGTVEEKV
jgi:hypothetical protein